MEYYLLIGEYAINGVINELIKAENLDKAYEIALREFPFTDGYRWEIKKAFEEFMPK